MAKQSYGWSAPHLHHEIENKLIKKKKTPTECEFFSFFFPDFSNRLSGEDPQKDLINMATVYGEVGGRVEFFFKNPTKTGDLPNA